MERAGLMTIVYCRDSTESCSEVEAGAWLWRRRSGEELIADQHVSRGWEASHVLVVDLFARIWHGKLCHEDVGLGYCALVKRF